MSGDGIGVNLSPSTVLKPILKWGCAEVRVFCQGLGVASPIEVFRILPVQLI